MANETIHEKTCPHCDLTKPLVAFHRNKSRRDGRAAYCIECASAYFRGRHPLDEAAVERDRTLPGEEWRAVIGFEDRYEVSNLGRVRRSAPRCGTYRGRVLTPAVNRSGRGYFTVGFEVRQRRQTMLIHRLVAAAFIGPAFDGAQVNHKNGDTRDNRLENLEYVTHQGNVTHARAVLRVGARKLTESDVREIRMMAVSGKLHKDIARRFGLASSTVTRIVNRLSWAHVV